MNLLLTILASLSVLSFGAKGDGTTINTQPIQAAIDATAARGGGRVEIPEGTYLCGTLFLRDGIELHLDEGAVLRGSPDIRDYCTADCLPQNEASSKAGDNTTGGHLVVAANLRNVSITGPGRIDGNSDAFLLDPDGKHWPSKHDIPARPGQMVWFVDCTGVRIENVEMFNSPYWTCFLLNCDNVSIRGCRIRSERRRYHTYNGDGLDIDRCRYVMISECDIDTSDDCITLRASSADRLKDPHDCAYVIVTGCRLSSACNAIRVGVGEGSIHDAVFSGIDISDTGAAFNYVAAYSAKERGTDISHIRTSDVNVQAKWFLKMHHMNSREAVFSDILFQDITGTSRKESVLRASPESPFRNIRFRNVCFDSGFQAVNADVKVEGGRFQQRKLSAAEKRKIRKDMAARRNLLY